MIFEAEDGAADAAPAPAAVAPEAPAPAAAAAELKEVHVPDIGGDEVEVTEIMVKVGDSIEEEQSLLTVEGDKASMEVPAPFAGVKEIKIAEGDKVTTGSLIMVFESWLCTSSCCQSCCSSAQQLLLQLQLKKK